MAKILSIEDDRDIQHLIGKVLFKAGYDVHYAWNGKEGYEKILQLDPDLILLDLVLPLMNGVELLKQLQERKISSDIPILIVTSYGDEAQMLHSSVVALGAMDYIRKPIQWQELVSIIKRLLEQHPRQRAAQPPVSKLSKGCLQVDEKFLTVSINDRIVATLSDKEFALLRCLIESPGPVAKEKLLRKLGYTVQQNDALKQIVHRLRQALGTTESQRIKTTTEGYILIG